MTLEIIAMMAALLMMALVVAAKIMGGQLIGRMKHQISQVDQLKREVLGRYKVAGAKTKVAESNKQQLEAKKKKLQKKIKRLQTEMKGLDEESEKRKARTNRTVERDDEQVS